MRIGKKYILTMIILVIVFFSVIEVFAYRNIGNVVSDLYQEMAYQELTYAEKALSNALRKLETAMRAPLYNTRFLVALRNHRIDRTDIVSALQQILYEDRSILRVCIYDTAGNIWHVGEVGWSLLPQISYESLIATPWGRRAYEASGYELFFRGDVLRQNESTPIITCCKLLREPGSGDPLGILIVSFTEELLSSCFMNTTIGAYAVTEPGPEPETLDPESFLYATDSMEELTGLDSAQLNIVSMRNRRTGWNLLGVSRKSALTSRANYIFITQGLFILAMGGFLFISFSVINRSLTRPVKRLYRMVEDFGRGVYRTDEVFANDEIGAIGNKFVEVMKENRQLTENYVEAKVREKEAEFQFLQAQINPHFIYNVLDSIYWMSALDGRSDAGEMAISLSRILRYSVNKDGGSLTTVEKELELIGHYLQIQNIRYRGKFRVRIDVDPSIRECPIIKFLLEPFVENAIVHGLENKPEGGSLQILGSDLGEEMEFRVIDDGIGTADESALYNGYGISNVIERVKRSYHTPESGIRITSSPGTGTTVVIRVSKEIAIR